MEPARYQNSPGETVDQNLSASKPAVTGELAVSEIERPEKSRQSALTRLEHWLVERVLSSIGNPPVTIAFWDGTEIGAHDNVLARILVHDRRTMWRVASDLDFQFAEAYTEGRIEIEGDLIELLATFNRVSYDYNSTDTRVGWRERWANRRRRNTLSRSKYNVHHHYDIGNEFYGLWLDEQLAYTCAYFAKPSFGLEQAQIAKMDHVCRKVWLRPGETVVEAGCGWGALALHMAREYGVTVTAYNISHEQIDYARRRAQREGLQDQVDFIEDDWRNITGRYDAFVSVGMLEHVGVSNYRQLGDVIHNCLNPDGRGLIHTIGRNLHLPTDRWIARRIFPGGYPPPLSEMAPIFEIHDFSVLDVENLRLHYTETLRHWLDRYERALEAVRGMFDEKFVRTWRLYLAGSAAGFEYGSMQLFQVVFSRGKSNAVPRNRLHLYAGESPAEPELFEAASGDSPRNDARV